MPNPTLSAGVLTAFFGLIANAATAQTIQGTASCREPVALPAGAAFEATLEEVSGAASASVIARTRVESPGPPPIAFTIAYDQSRIAPDRLYVVRARVVLADTLLFTSIAATPVITRGSPTSVSLTLRPVLADRPPPADPDSPTPAAAPNRSLETTYWKALELAGQATPAQDASREAHLVFRAGRVSGSDGCNPIAGSYEVKDDEITLAQMAATQVSCGDTADLERGIRAALGSARRWRIVGERLDLLDATGATLATFEARSRTPPPMSSPELPGTAWQLVQFQGGDGTILRPDEASRYTIEFGAGGRLAARIDCNRGAATWESAGSGQLTLAPLALTRAQCPPGSLHDQIARQWTDIRSYVIKDGHLFLSLMADGGIYEFEPLPAAAK